MRRVGVPRSRLEGARLSTSEVLVFLDAHSETLEDWLRPLLQRISHFRTAVLTPLIDTIDEYTFAFEDIYEQVIL